MMKPLKELVRGSKFNKLTVVERAKINKDGNAVWVCMCDCGKTYEETGYNLTSGHVKSCGCLKGENHQMHKTRQYTIFSSMKSRCFNVKAKNYKDYGGRGITVCDEWSHSFVTFWDDMKEGYSDKLTLDRIDNNGDYCKGNCRWATAVEQGRNRRNNRIIDTVKGKMCLEDASKLFGIQRATIYRRISLGWQEKDLLNPVYSSYNKN